LARLLRSAQPYVGEIHWQIPQLVELSQLQPPDRALAGIHLFEEARHEFSESRVHFTAFNTLLRDFDLNDDMQNGYAITEGEYRNLMTAWKELPRRDQIQLMNGDTQEFWPLTYVQTLIIDLNNGVSWKIHSERMINVGAGGVSLTLSRHRTPVAVSAARKMLIDLLHKGTSMFGGGKLAIAEEIKMAAKKRAGTEAQQRLEKWQKLINGCQNYSTMKKLRAVNEFFNQLILPRNDDGTENGYDYWQSPIETLARGAGDCDDFAMAKYVSLRLLGIPAAQLRVCLAQNFMLGNHAVLCFFPENERDPWVLDNLTFSYDRRSNNHILRLSVRMKFHHLEPIYGINETMTTVFQNGLQEKVIDDDPRRRFPKFAMALVNSYRLLP
jgi:predicted transglutaminase-like cysteine proteinase